MSSDKEKRTYIKPPGRRKPGRLVLITPYKVQQPRLKYALSATLRNVDKLKDYKCDPMNLADVFSHLEKNGIDCQQVRKQISKLRLSDYKKVLFFGEGSRNGNICD